MRTIYIITSPGDFDHDGKQKQQNISFCNFFYWTIFNLVTSFDATHKKYWRPIREKNQAEMMIARPDKYGRKTPLNDVTSFLCYQDPEHDAQMLQFVTDELRFLVRNKNLQTYYTDGTPRPDGSPMIALLCDLLEEYFSGFVDYTKEQNLNQSTIDGDFAIFVLIFWYAAKKHQIDSDSLEIHQPVDSDYLVAQSFIETVASIFSDVFGNAPGQNWNLKLKVWVEDNVPKSGTSHSSLLDVELLEFGTNSPSSVKLEVPYFVLNFIVDWQIFELEVVHPEALMAGLDRNSPQYSSQCAFLTSVLATGQFQ